MGLCNNCIGNLSELKPGEPCDRCGGVNTTNRKLTEARIWTYRVDLDRLHNHKGKICPCLNPNMEQNQHTSNMCPCDELTLKGKCRCGIFTKEN